MKIKIFISILFLINFNYTKINAGVIESGHNMYLQLDKNDLIFNPGSNPGVCGFCHIPHSSESNMYPSAPEQNFNPKWGYIGKTCANCHGKIISNGNAPSMVNSIFTGPNYNSHPLVDDNSDKYGTASISNTGPFFGGTKQWLSGWIATNKDRTVTFDTGNGQESVKMMECISCHNVHEVTPGVNFNDSTIIHTYDGNGDSGDFLRALPFDTNNILGNENEYRPQYSEDNPKQIFCEYCHVGRARSGWGTYNTATVDGIQYSTHPVGIPGPVSKIGYKENDSTARRIYDKNSGWDGSIEYDSIFKRDATFHPDNSLNLSGGHLGGIEEDSQRMGYGTTNTGIVICQTCHQVHNARQGMQYNNNIPLMNPDENFALLVEDNSSNTGFNLLCEKCHSERPFLRVAALDPITGDSTKIKGHPLRHHKYNEGNYNANYKGSFWDSTKMLTGNSCQDSDNPSDEAAIIIPAVWPTGGQSGTNTLVCLSCHDVHKGKPGTKILRAIPLCIECHKKSLNKLGITHPVDVSLINTDGATWPDQANLILFTPQEFDKNGKVIKNSEKMYPELDYDINSKSNVLKKIKSNFDIVKITCETCHDWTNGYFHYDVARLRDPQLEVDAKNNRLIKGSKTKGHHHAPDDDPNANSELCVSCHTNDNFRYLMDDNNIEKIVKLGSNIRLDGTPLSKTGDLGIGGEGANPSFWIIEYPNISDWQFTGKNLNPGNGKGLSMENKPSDRTGSHAAQLHIVNDENPEGQKGHKSRFEWIYYSTWGDKSGGNDPYYFKEDECNRISSGKASKWGREFDIALDKEESKDKAKIICESCHTAHNAAVGLVEYNTAGVGKEPSPHTALLYATQAESFMCRTCHKNGGENVHPMSQPSAIEYRGREDDDYYNIMNIVGRNTQTSHYHTILLTYEQELNRANIENEISVLYLRDDKLPDQGGYKWRVGLEKGPMPPANYPRIGGSLNNPGQLGLPGTSVDISQSIMTCDSCHAPHSAGTANGTYCLEGNDTTVPSKNIKINFDAASGFGNGAAQPTTPNDTPTCILCHIQ